MNHLGLKYVILSDPLQPQLELIIQFRSALLYFEHFLSTLSVLMILMMPGYTKVRCKQCGYNPIARHNLTKHINYRHTRPGLQCLAQNKNIIEKLLHSRGILEYNILWSLKGVFSSQKIIGEIVAIFYVMKTSFLFHSSFKFR